MKSSFRRKPKDQIYLRVSNTLMVLEAIETMSPVSRAELAKIVNMSPTSITRLVDDLIQIGFVKETDLYSSGVGRKAIMLDVVPDCIYTVGVHVDNNYLRVCMTDFTKRPLPVEHAYLSEAEKTPSNIVNTCLQLYHRILKKHNIDSRRVISMGVGIVGIADPISRNVLLSPQFSWDNLPLGDEFERVFQLPVILDNDAKASLIGEMSLLGIPFETDTTLLNLGTGVGSAAVTKGEIVRGKQNAAGEVGHIIVDHLNGTKCECGRTGCLQTHVAIKYLLAKANKHDSSISNLSDLRQAYEDGKLWAKDIIDDCIEHVSFALEIITCMYNPEKTIVGGILLSEFESILPDVLAKFKSKAIVPNMTTNDIVSSLNYDKACSLGCAIVARDRFLPKYIQNSIQNSSRNYSI